jgi:membrane protein
MTADRLARSDAHTESAAVPPRGRKSRLRIAGAALEASVSRFLANDVLTLAAALAFYTILSFAPLIVLAIWAASLAGPHAQDALLDEIGGEARAAAQAVIENSKTHPEIGSVAGIAGIVMLVVGSTTVFAQLQSSLNVIFGVVSTPANAIWGWLRQRILSLGVIFAIAFVLIVSLVVSAALAWLLPRGGVALNAANQGVAAIVFALLFGLLFRYLPDARIPWRAAMFGGLATAILFALGKWAISVYLAHGDVGGAYGAAGSLVVLLVWVYYSAAIFFYGAELTAAGLDVVGVKIAPMAHAKRRDEGDASMSAPSGGANSLPARSR